MAPSTRWRPGPLVHVNLLLVFGPTFWRSPKKLAPLLSSQSLASRIKSKRSNCHLLAPNVEPAPSCQPWSSLSALVCIALLAAVVVFCFSLAVLLSGPTIKLPEARDCRFREARLGPFTSKNGLTAIPFALSLEHIHTTKTHFVDSLKTGPATSNTNTD